MAKDVFHKQVKNALIKDRWKITHAPLTIGISEVVKLQIYLAAENAIAAERNSEKIAVEIKSFIGDSDISTFHTALGQYLNYCQAIEEQEPERIVYLAINLQLFCYLSLDEKVILYEDFLIPMRKHNHYLLVI